MITEFLTFHEYARLQIQMSHKQVIEVQVQDKANEVKAYVKAYTSEPIGAAPADKRLRALIERNYQMRMAHVDKKRDGILHIPKKCHTKYNYTKDKWDDSIFNPKHPRSIIK